MADAADQAGDLTDIYLSAAISRANQTPKTLPAKGECYNCEEPLPDKERFCDHDCRDDYEYRESRK